VPYANRYDDSDTRRLLRSAALAALVWTVLGVALAFLPAFRRTDVQKQYRDVAITLAPPEKKVLAASELPRPEPPAAKPDEKPVEPEKTPQKVPEKTAAPKSALASKSGPAAQKPAAPKPASSASAAAASRTADTPKSAGLGIPNFSAPVQSSSAASSDAEYLDFSSQTASRQQEARRTPDGGNPEAELLGSAGIVRKDEDSGAAAARPERTPPGQAAAETSSALEKIAGTAKSPSSSNAASADASAGTAGMPNANAQASGTAASPSIASSSVSGLAFDGVPRKILQPAVPAIALPENLARLVDSDRRVEISFTVLEDGTVPVGTVSFTPSAALPAEIRDYLKREFSHWRFEKHTDSGQAKFVYSIRMQ